MKKIWMCIFAVLLLCVGCGSGAESNKKNSEEVAYASMYKMSSASSEGALSFENGVILYQDTKSKKEEKGTPLCTKANCKHTSESECTAYYGCDELLAFYFDSKLFVIANGDMGKSSLYTAGQDGSNRKKQLELDVQVGTGTTVIAKNGMIFALMDKVSVDEKSGEVTYYPTIIKIDYENNSVETIAEPKKEYQAKLELQRVDSQNIYYVYRYWDYKKEVVDQLAKAKDEEYNRLADQYEHVYACKKEIQGDKKADTNEVKKSSKYSVISQNEQNIYLSDENYNLIARNRRTEKDKMIWKAPNGDGIYYCVGLDNYYLVGERKDGAFLYHKISCLDGAERKWKEKKRTRYSYEIGDQLLQSYWDIEGEYVMVREKYTDDIV